MTAKLIINYYSDVLCVWAWIAQRRVEELIRDFGEQIDLHYLYVDIFGDTRTKINTQWATRGLYDGFSEHVVKSAAKFEHAPVNERIWKEVKPATSANAHLLLKAVALIAGDEISQLVALDIRKAFFVEAKDIGNLALLKSILQRRQLNMPAIEECINNGGAVAALMRDYQQAREQSIKGSPSFVLDSGRQILYGNVGYRVLHSNVEELLYHSEDEASWC